MQPLSLGVPVLSLCPLLFAFLRKSPDDQPFIRKSEHQDSSHRPHRLPRRRTILVPFVFACPVVALLSGCGASLSVGKGPDALVAKPGSIAFGSLPVGTSAKADVTLVNETLKPIEIRGVTTSGRFFSLLNNVSVPVRVPVGGSYHLTVTFTPMQPGAASGDLIISTLANATARPVVHLSGQATKNSSITPSSATLTINATSASFGDVAVNTTATQSLTLTSTGATAVNISDASITGAGFTSTGLITPATLPPGQSVILNVQFHPTAQGASSGALVISSNSASNGTMSLPLAGNGVPQLVQLSWEAPGSSSPVAGYRIYRSIDGVSQFHLLNTSLSAYTEFTDSSIQTGQTYDYYVTTVDTSGAESAPSNTATVAVPSA
jgi:Abnormal spindle-like microcephaly-assoc'd, ASPM-SPD-2-Hydin